MPIPHNQRRLNTKIKEHYGDRYTDWYDLAIQMMDRGDTLEDVQKIFAMLGIDVVISTIHNWLKDRRQIESESHENAA
ncbi:hypothetical protein M0R72_15710 [Candidatus Pacearchaeota archaeon]|jgi:transposase-like protein|nr:hypothetical protein [Candidatus Pacearchaeota archaeon]